MEHYTSFIERIDIMRKGWKEKKEEERKSCLKKTGEAKDKLPASCF